MGKREHSFLSILLKPQIFIPSKLGEIRGNEIRFNEFLLKLSKIPLILLGTIKENANHICVIP